jgi:hypothetical protein
VACPKAGLKTPKSRLFQLINLHVAILAAEGERTTATLLLRDAADSVIAAIIDGDVSILLDRQSARVGEEGVSNIVLAAARRRFDEIVWPPLRAEVHGLHGFHRFHQRSFEVRWSERVKRPGGWWLDGNLRICRET